MKISIRNTGKNYLIIRMLHEICCVGEGSCFCVDGQPSSLHIAAGCTAKNVPASIVPCIDEKTKKVLVISSATKAEARTSAEPVAAVEDGGQTTGKVRRRRG